MICREILKRRKGSINLSKGLDVVSTFDGRKLAWKKDITLDGKMFGQYTKLSETQTS